MNLLSKKVFKPSNHSIKNLNLFGFDIETYGNKNKFLMASIVSDNNTHVFWSKKTLIDFLLNSKELKNGIIFATNLGFDFLGTFGKDYKYLSKFNYIIRGSDFITIKYVKPNHRGTIVYLDTMNFYKTSVKNLGKIIGLPKLKYPKKLMGTKVLKDSPEGKLLERYNIRDSEITFKFSKFINGSFNSIGADMKSTIASTSMSLFRNKYLKTWIIQPKKEVIIEQQKGYYGGRTETFVRGKIDGLGLSLYDINSLYPYVMQKYKYPHPNTIQYTDSPKSSIVKYEGLSYVKVKVPKNLHIPLLPHRYNNKLCFPIGSFFGWHSHVELRKAIQLGYKIDFISSYYYEKSFNPFNSFVNDLYNKRMYYKKNNNSLEYTYKILLNSLYGKFAQRIYNTDIYFTDNEKQNEKIKKVIQINNSNAMSGLTPRYDIDTPNAEEIEDDDGNIIIKPKIYYVTDMESPYYPSFINPILSIYTTAYARLELYKLFEKVQHNNGTVYYCDTDSIITDYKFKESKKLGGLKKEIPIDKGLLIKPKFYYLEEYRNKQYIKCKGIRNLQSYNKDKIKRFQESELNFLNLVDTKKHSYKKFTKFKESLRRDFSFNQIIDIHKTIDIEDNKRIWQGSFNKNKLQRSKPLNLNQLF